MGRGWVIDVNKFFAGLFLFVLFYYWVVLCVHNPKDGVDGVRYVAFVAPVAVFVALASIFSLARRRLNREVLLVVFSILLILFYSLLRGDYVAAYSVTLLFLVFAIFFHFHFEFDFSLINYIFLFSIVSSVISHGLGLGEFGYFPGQSSSSESQGLAWRVSLFPSLPESAFFSATVLVVNYLYRDLAFRRLVMVLAVYFLLFSGLRSAVLAAAIALVFAFATKNWGKGSRGWLVVLYFLMLSLFFAVVLISDLLLVLAGLDVPFLKAYIFRSLDGVVDSESVSSTVYRGWLWMEHVKIWSNDYVMGVGTFSFRDYVPVSIIEGHQGSGSESFFTGLLARVGIPALLLLMAIFMFVRKAIRSGCRHVAPVSILLVVAMFSYGSFIVPYNFVFLLMMGLVSWRSNDESIVGEAS